MLLLVWHGTVDSSLAGVGAVVVGRVTSEACLGIDRAGVDGGLQCPVVAVVLVGVGLGELDERTVEALAVAEVSGNAPHNMERRMLPAVWRDPIDVSESQRNRPEMPNGLVHR